MLGIIGAMDVEVNSIKSKITDKTVTTVAKNDFVCGKIEGVEVCVAQCGIGKVNAALCTQIMIDRFGADRIINVGVGCSLSNDVVIKDVVVANDVCEHDMDITPLGDPKGYIYGVDRIKMPADKEMSASLEKTAISCGEKVHRGTVASGDFFIASQKQKDDIVNEFGAICGEMEGGAIGHVCLANGVPFAVLRSISDGGNEDAQMDYPAFKLVAAEISTRIILNFIKSQK